MVCIFYLGLCTWVLLWAETGWEEGQWSGEEEWVLWGWRGNPPCAGASAGSNGVCMPGTPGDWYWVEPVGSVCIRDGEIHFALLEDKCAVE